VDSFPQPLTHYLVRLRLLNILWSLVVVGVAVGMVVVEVAVLAVF
jgi:hypothetical protein